MKKVLLTLALTVTAVAVFAQGKVSFANDSTRLFEFGNFRLSGDAAGPIPTSPTGSGTTLVAALYAGTSASSLALQTSIPLIGTSWLAAGRMATKTIILTTGTANQSFDIILVNAGATLPPQLMATWLPALTLITFPVLLLCLSVRTITAQAVCLR